MTTTPASFHETLTRLSQGSEIPAPMMEDAFLSLMKGEVDQSDIARFLTTLKERGESTQDITAGARILRRLCPPLNAPDDAIDCCGTGGDGLHSLNISTAVAFVCAGLGLKVAKHGNRAASSKSGAADVLEALGVPLSLPRAVLEGALNDIGFCFLMAPVHHSAMRHVAQVRKNLGFRTIFNLLGPLVNPAGVKRQLIGVYDQRWLLPMAESLRDLGCRGAWVVHGHDGMDEITLTAPTTIAILKDGGISSQIITPDDFGLGRVTLNDLRGGDAHQNANALLDILGGIESAYSHMVMANAAGALVMTGMAHTLRDGVDMAKTVLKNGAAMRILDRYRALKQEDYHDRA